MKMTTSEGKWPEARLNGGCLELAAIVKAVAIGALTSAIRIRRHRVRHAIQQTIII